MVANAIIHADYGASSGADIRIILTNDSLTAHNPDTLLVDRDVAIAGGFSETRNPTLMRIFSFIGASDRAGSGLEMIFANWKRLFEASPTLEEEHSPSSVILSLPIYESTGNAVQNDGKNRKLSVDELLAALASSQNGMTPKDVQKLFCASERVGQKRLKELFDKGRLSREKEGRSWRYRLER